LPARKSISRTGSSRSGTPRYTTASLVQTLRSLADALAALDVAHASVKDGVVALRATETKVAPVIRDYTTFLRATFSNATAQLGDFGVQAHKARQPLVTEKRVVATAKLKATRKARGTTSKKQKLAVKGDVTGVVMTPVTHPAPASPPATPAGPAPAAARAAHRSRGAPGGCPSRPHEPSCGRAGHPPAFFCAPTSPVLGTQREVARRPRAQGRQRVGCAGLN
jgi:hypothetical protein